MATLRNITASTPSPFSKVRPGAPPPSIPSPSANIPAPCVLFFAPQILLLTDGTCGSACSFFESRLVVDGGGTAVSYGGLLDAPMDTSSFGGGGVTGGWDTYLETVRDPQVRSTLPQLVSTAYVTFTSSEFYLPTAPLPREWLRLEAELRYPIWPNVLVVASPVAFLYAPLAIIAFDDTPTIATAPALACMAPNRTAPVPPSLDGNAITSTWLRPLTNDTTVSVTVATPAPVTPAPTGRLPQSSAPGAAHAVALLSGAPVACVAALYAVLF